MMGERMNENNATILVVDDDRIMCLLLESILEKAGYKVLITRNGESVLQCVIEHNPTLILLDIMLPDISGYEVYKRLKGRNSAVDIPVIFITSSDERSIWNACNEIGYSVDYILKPPCADILLSRIANILEVVHGREKLRERNEQLKREIAKRDQFAAVVQQSIDSVLLIDEKGIIVYVNPACEMNSGYSSAEMVGMLLQDLPHVKKDTLGFQEMIDSIRAGEEWYGNIHSLKKNGSIYLEESSALPIWNEEGGAGGYVVTKKDVTERCRLESIASSINLMDNVGFVFSGIRHELGNPVNSLKMTLSVLAKKIDQFSRATTVEFLERSQNEIDRIEYLLKSLRSFSMFEKPVPDTVFLPDFMDNILDIHRKDLEMAQVKISVHIAEDAKRVYADPRALVQVMLNLLANALHSLEGCRQPLITISTSKESESLVCLTITDNGCGISETNREKLFKPFFTTRAEGTGLGLVIVRKMLAEMDCSIQVQSKEYEGATFSILLPVSF